MTLNIGAFVSEIGLAVCVRLELALLRLGIASLPIDVMLNCDDLVYAALALNG